LPNQVLRLSKLDLKWRSFAEKIWDFMIYSAAFASAA